MHLSQNNRKSWRSSINNFNKEMKITGHYNEDFVHDINGRRLGATGMKKGYYYQITMSLKNSSRNFWLSLTFVWVCDRGLWGDTFLLASFQAPLINFMNIIRSNPQFCNKLLDGDP